VEKLVALGVVELLHARIRAQVAFLDHGPEKHPWPATAWQGETTRRRWPPPGVLGILRLRDPLEVTALTGTQHPAASRDGDRRTRRPRSAWPAHLMPEFSSGHLADLLDGSPVTGSGVAQPATPGRQEGLVVNACKRTARPGLSSPAAWFDLRLGVRLLLVAAAGAD